jgi:biopolymer transport protein ExbB/TolQ
VIWLLVVFSVATWGLALLKGVQFGRLKVQDRKFHKQFWAASSLDSAAELAETQPGAADLDDFAHDFYSLAQKSSLRVLIHPTAHKTAASGCAQKVKEAS